MDEKVIDKLKVAIDTFYAFFEENPNQFRCASGYEHCVRDKCTFYRGKECLLRQLSMSLKSVGSAIKNQTLYQIAAPGWVSRKKFRTVEEAEKAVPWVAYILCEKEEDVKVVRYER